MSTEYLQKSSNLPTCKHLGQKVAETIQKHNIKLHLWDAPRNLEIQAFRREPPKRPGTGQFDVRRHGKTRCFARNPNDSMTMTALKHRKIRGFGAITFSKHRKIRYLMQNKTEISETSLNTRLWNDHILKTSQNAIPYAQWDRNRAPGRVLWGSDYGPLGVRLRVP